MSNLGGHGMALIEAQERVDEEIRAKYKDMLHTDRYEIVKELGRGTWGAVYEAKDKILDKKVAVKILDPNETAKAQMKERNLDAFAAMQKEWALAPCANVVPRSFEVDNSGRPYIVMPVYGQFLEDVLGDRADSGERKSVDNGISLENAIEIIKDTANGLAEMHEKMGRVHGDLKPDNIAIDKRGRALISDLGTSTCSSFFGRSVSPRDNIGCINTRAYECFGNGKEAHPSTNSDAYAWAALAFRIFSGKYPWEDELRNTEDPARYFAELGEKKINSIVRDKVRKNIPRKFRGVIGENLGFEPYLRGSFWGYDGEKDNGGGFTICSKVKRIAEDVGFIDRLKKGFRKWTVNMGLPVALLGGLAYLGATHEPQKPDMPEKLRINGLLYKDIDALKENERIEFESEKIENLPDTPTGLALQRQGSIAKQCTDNRVVAYLVKSHGQAMIAARSGADHLNDYQNMAYLALTSPDERKLVESRTDSFVHPRWAKMIEYALNESKTESGKVDLEDVMAISRLGTSVVAQAKRVSGSQDWKVYREAKDARGKRIIPKDEAGFINAWLAYYHADVD